MSIVWLLNLPRVWRSIVAQLRHVGEVEDRLAHFEPHRRVHLVDVEQVRLRPDERHQRHHDGFPDRVDRRVRDLRKQLLEVAVERLVLVRQDRQRRVVAHRADALLAGLRHRAHQKLEVFLRHAESLLAVEQADVGARRRHVGDVARHVVELDAKVLDPLLVGLAVREIAFELLVVDHSPLIEVDQEHAARLQPPLAHDLRFGHRQHAGLGAHDHHVVVGDAVARRAQAVAIKRGTDLAAVGEHDRCGAVPRLHHRGVIFVERAAAVVHRAVVFPRLGDHHHDRVADRVAGHRQQFEAVVERGGVRLVREADRIELLQVRAQHRRGHHAFARAHPVVVALDGVDLAVVRDIAVRMRERPLGERVGREPLVHEAERRHATCVLQVAVVGADLIGEQQPLVDHGAAAHARHVVLLAVRELQALDRGAGGLADHVELALERVLHDHVIAAADEDLTKQRLLGAHGRAHRHFGVYRHVAPAEQHLAFGMNGALHLLLASQPRGVLLGQKDHADAVLAGCGQGHALLFHLLAVQRIGQLQQDAGPVPHQVVGADRAAVVEVFQNLQRLLHDRMALLALDVRDEADAARIVFVRRVVQAALGEVLNVLFGGHVRVPGNVDIHGVFGGDHGLLAENSRQSRRSVNEHKPLQHRCQRKYSGSDSLIWQFQ